MADLKLLRPGDSIPVKEQVATYNNTFHPIPDERTYLKRKTRKRTRGGRRVELFEKHRAGGISKVHIRMRSDRL